MVNYNKVLGSLLGGAVGDALGYPVEFMSERQIFDKYGKLGITEYDLVSDIAEISDDTQMTLFTANGLLMKKKERDIPLKSRTVTDYIAYSYAEWLTTQSRAFSNSDKESASRLLRIPQLFSCRAPGGTCLSSLRQFAQSGKYGSIEHPINNSKGCGGIMRIAPIGLFYEDAKEAALVAAKASAITHGHELGYIPSAMLAYMISLLSHGEGVGLKTAALTALNETEKLFYGKTHLSSFSYLINLALALSETETDDLSAIHILGEGWVAEETLAISLFASLRHENDFRGGVISAANHNGDSDSTAAVTGNILGAYLGINGIPETFLKNLELRAVIEELAFELR